MKKLFTLLSLLFIGINAQSQQLQNTQWTVTDTADVFYIFFKFNVDTLAYSYDDISYTNIATYQESGNNFTMIDLPSGPCPSDTGMYTFLIANDTLYFTLVSDSCPTRPAIFQDYNWFVSNVGLNELANSSIQVYPNPAIDKITIQTPAHVSSGNYWLTDQMGRKVLEGKLKPESTTVNIEHLKEGSYYLQTSFESKPYQIIIAK